MTNTACKRIEMLQWSTQSPDLRTNEMLDRSLRELCIKNPRDKIKLPLGNSSASLNELKQCKEEWAKSPPQDTDSQGFLQVITSKGGPVI